MKREESTPLALRESRPELPGRFVAPTVETDGGGGPTLPARLHAILRGRYHWAILLGLALGAAGAYGGYHASRPLYSSDAVIKIEPVLPRILYKSEKSDTMPAFDTFVNTQVSILQSGSVIDHAYASDAWQAIDPARRGPRKAVARNLEVEAPQTTRGLIKISYTDLSPEAAQVGAQAIYQAYDDLFGNRDEVEQEKKLQLLEGRKAALERELETYNNQILQLAREMGSDALEDTYKFKLGEANKLESEWMDTKVALTLAEAALHESRRTDRPPVELTADEVAKMDVKMQELLRMRRDRAIAIDEMAIHYKKNHPKLIDEKKALARLDEKIAARVKEFSASRSAAVVENVSAGQGDDAIPAVLRVEQLRLKEERLGELAKFARGDAENLGRKNITIKQLKLEADEVKGKLDDTKERLTELGVESVVGGRVKMVTPSELPSEPVKDSRLKLAIAGGGAGWMMGIGFVMLLGALDSRLKKVDDLRGEGVLAPVLGIVPVLPPGGGAARAELAAASVHRIRALLQVAVGWESRRVIAVTSPAAGTGKTSLTVGLGVSFAMSGTRTLLIDCDLSGGGLRARMKEAARHARKKNKNGWVSAGPEKEFGLDATMADLGYIGPQDELDRMLATMDARPVGLMGVLDGRALSDCVKSTHIQGLSILPSVGLDGKDVSRLSPGFLSKLIHEAKKHYDMILIDTGPVPDSVEGSISAAAADAVILNVCRGEHGDEVTEALKHLQSIGVKSAGLVFNRAEATDAVTNPASYRGKTKPSRKNRPASPRVRPTGADEIFGSGILAMAVSERSSKNSGGPA